MINAIAKYASCGFRGKYWEAGEVAENITADESKMKEMKHFTIQKDNSNPPPDETKHDEITPTTLAEAEQRRQLDLLNKTQMIEKLIAAGVDVPGNLNKEALINLCIQNKIKAE